MRKITLWALALTALLITGCKTNENDNSYQYSISDIAGEWVWLYKDGQVMYYGDITIDSIGKDGKGIFYENNNGKWTKENSSFTLNDNVITYTYPNRTSSYKILSCSFETFIIEKEETGVCYEGQRVMDDYSKEILGEWIYQDEEKNLTVTTSFDKTSAFSTTIVKNGQTVFTNQGKYSLFGRLLVRESDQSYNAGCISFETTEKGRCMRSFLVDSATVYNIPFYKVRKAYTLEDVSGSWILSSSNGENVSLQEVSFWTIDSIGGYYGFKNKDGLWKGIAGNGYTVEDNVIISNNNDEYRSRILFADRSTLTVKNQQGNIKCYTKIMFPDKYAEDILGHWENQNATLMNGQTDDMKWIVDKDSIRLSIDGNDFINRAYKLFGDVLVSYDYTSCYIFPISFGYDITRGQRYVQHHFEERTTTLYRLNVEKIASGAWLWVQKNGHYIPTSKVGISYVNTDLKTIFCRNLYNDSTSSYKYTISNNYFLYPDHPEWPYDRVVDYTDSSMTMENSENNLYTYLRLSDNAELKNGIIGKWTCDSFNINNEIAPITHIFNKNGLVSMIRNNDTIYATYELYSQLLVMRLESAPHNILWFIYNDDLDGGKMEWGRL